MIEQNLQQAVSSALMSLYNINVAPETVVLQTTKREFEGDYTVVVFPYVKQARRSPEQLANELGAAVKASVAEVEDYNVIKGFLNFSVADGYWLQFVSQTAGRPNYGIKSAS
ncbi:MAG: arginine--tRNA ligase, partial [Bacteroidales bacterium]|nr:arginine--tRNA ligase [Bacteroidales bacterium]